MAIGPGFPQLSKNLLDRGEVTGVAHLVEVEHDGRALPEQPPHHRAADEAGATGHQNPAALTQKFGGGRHGLSH